MSPPKAKKQKINYDPEEISRLESRVFGIEKDVVEDPASGSDSDPDDDDQEIQVEMKSEEEEDDDDDDDQAEDCQDSDDNNSNPEDVDSKDCDESEEELEEKPEIKKRAWIDEDDQKFTVQEAMKLQERKVPVGVPEKMYQDYAVNAFKKIHGTPKWAEVRTVDEDDDDSDHEILKRSNHLHTSKTRKLRGGTIDIKAMRNINHHTENEGPQVTALQFHPSLSVAFVAGLSRRLTIFKIDGKENTVLDRVYFEKFSISSAKFLKEGNEIIAGSRFSNLSKVYNVMTGITTEYKLPHDVTNMKYFEVSPDGKIIAVAGKRGEIHLLTGLTKEKISTLKMNDTCRAIAFTPDSRTLISHGDGNTIYSWDLTSRSCINKAFDDGCLGSRAIAVSPNGQFFATGSNQGIVNIYDAKLVQETTTPQPLKIIKNLVTPITCLKFNPASEILALSSDKMDNAFKMVHIPSLKVFSNFPTINTVMHHPVVMDFSPGGGYLGVSNNKGKAYLYRLNHYGNY